MCRFRQLAAAVAYCSIAVAHQTVPKAYFIELSKNSSVDGTGAASSPDTIVQAAAELSIPLRVRYQFLDQTVFYGLSVSLELDDHVQTLRSLPGVENVVPVQRMTHPHPHHRPSSAAGISRASERETSPDESGSGSGSGSEQLLSTRSPVSRDLGVDWNSPHAMTGVDRLHARGILGDGVRIAIIDTGIDYLHPALGGCFGQGCKVEFGYDLVGDDYGARNFTPNPSADPRPGCYAGFHGTHVAGIAGMDAPPDSLSSSVFAGLVGVAPRATLGMYRVFGCDGTTSHDAIVAAMQKSVEAGADVVSISICELGAWSGYPLSPLSAAVAALKAKGVAVVAAAGNSGARGMFSIKLPAGADDALGVASVENAKFPTYPVRDSNGASFRYGSLYPLPKGVFSVVWAGGDGSGGDYGFGCSASDYPPASRLPGPMSDYIVAIKRGRSCSPSQIQSHAVAANYTRVITYPDPTTRDVLVEGHAAPGPFLTADGSEFSMSSAVDDTLFNAAAAKGPGTYQLFVDSQEPSLVDQPGGGLPSTFSSIGPNADFAFKPQLAAPGGMILSTLPLMDKSRGYGFVSGTSMATPYVSGVYALIKSQRPSLSVDEIFARMQTTAKPVGMADRDSIAPAIQQGAGLVQAYEALFSKSAVSPGAFGLVDSRGEAAFTIGNPSDDDVVYTLANIPAAGAVAFPEGRSRPSEVDFIPRSFSAGIRFVLPGDRITVPAGSSLNVSFLVDPPPPPCDILDPGRIPVFSGFIGIVSSLNETFTIPYMGPAYNYSSAPVVGLSDIHTTGGAQRSNAPTPPPPSSSSSRDPFSAPQVFARGDGVDIGDYRPFSFRGSDHPVACFTTLQPVRKFRFDIVRASTGFTPTWYGFDPGVRLDNLTETAMADHVTVAGVSILGSIMVQDGWLPHTNYQASWSDSILDARAARELGLKKGSYRVLLRWLKFFRDEDDAASWDSWMSGVVDVLEDVFCTDTHTAPERRKDVSQALSAWFEVTWWPYK